MNSSIYIFLKEYQRGIHRCKSSNQLIVFDYYMHKSCNERGMLCKLKLLYQDTVTSYKKCIELSSNHSTTEPRIMVCKPFLKHQIREC